MANNNKKTQNQGPEMVAQADAEQMQPEEPKGHQEREQFKRRADNLEQQAEAMAAQMMMGAVDPKNLQIAREIAHRIGSLDISNKRDDMVYWWVNAGRQGQHVRRAQMIGWEVVQGNDPEAEELKGERGDTTRIFGDTILMKMPKDRFVVLKALAIQRQRQLEGASAARLMELSEKYRGQGFAVRPYGMDSMEGPPIRPGRFSKNQAQNWLQRQAAEQELREGNKLQRALR